MVFGREARQLPKVEGQVTHLVPPQAEYQDCRGQGVGEKKESLQSNQKGIDLIFNSAHLSAVNVVICYGSQLIILKSQNHIY